MLNVNRPAVLFDPRLSDRERLERIYAGDVIVYGPTPESRQLVDLARGMVHAAFPEVDPATIHDVYPVERTNAILKELKPAFIHHEQSKLALCRLLLALGASPERTYFDVPRMRSAFHKDYLSTGIAFAFPHHRDTWYSAPHSQVNFWIPMWDYEEGNGMSFHFGDFARPVANDSEVYNYAEHVRTSRFNAAEFIGKDTRKMPRALGPVDDDGVVLVVPPGSIIVFSGAQLHATRPNVTGRVRWSIDFRTVNLDDVRSRRGARNVDSRCSGTTMGDYLQILDNRRHVPDDLIAAYDAPAVPEA